MVIRSITTLLAISLSLLNHLWAAGRGFAIVIDTPTYTACRSSVDQYAAMLVNDGFEVYMLVDNWQDPVAVKEKLFSLYSKNDLEGAIFIGQIPIPMIRDAQHLTSAFKMDQDRYPFDQSSVPSDRYYDDFDLKFDYLGKDSVKTLFHYYSLRCDSPQKIDCDIYTGRLKPVRAGEEGYVQIRNYFSKLLKERKSGNNMDVLVSYTGEGSFSNSLTAWKEEGITLKEQFPGAFKNRRSAKFLFYDMYPSMKQTVIEELQREDVDLMLFHEHGTPDRQYLTGIPLSKGGGEYIEAAKALFRNKLRKAGKDSEESGKLINGWMKYYNIDSTWFTGAFDSEQLRKDSLEEISRGIVLEDVPEIKPNPRIVIFDACYNGDFREDRYIAGEYIFAAGKCVVCIGNSVNVLQDKSSSDQLGLLSLGYSVGEWARLTNILESHIIGDPTFRFEPLPSALRGDADKEKACLRSRDFSYWLDLFNESEHPDLKGLALNRLFALNYPALPELLLVTYKESPSYMLRLQVYHLLQHYNDGRFEEMLKLSVNDPYEFIRRKSVHSMGRIGKDEFIPYVASAWLNDYLDERVKFNAEFSFDLYDMDKLEKEVLGQIEQSDEIFDKDKKTEQFEEILSSRKRLSKGSLDVSDRELKISSRLLGASMLRNNNYHKMTDLYIKVLSDNSENLNLRIKLAEALGWFTLSCKKGEIISACREIASRTDTDGKLKNELIKTANRLEVYMR